MMTRAIKSDKGVAVLKPKAKSYLVAVANVPGLFVRVQPSGAKSFVAIAKKPNGDQQWKRIDNTALTVAEAEKKGRETLRKIKAGESLAPAESFQAIATEWLKRHVDGKGLRSKPTIEHYLNSYILPAWGSLLFVSIRRGQVAKLLDEIEDSAGARSADYALSVVRGICNWHATRADDYNSPIVRGMRRSNPKERERDRILNDDELRAVWKQAEACGTFGAFVRILLLTAQRRDTVAAMRWADVAVDGSWLIPSEDRAKGTGGELVLPPIALEIIKAQNHFADNPHVFASRGVSHLRGYSKAKAAFDAKVKIAPWKLHDLRRTARSLMSRAGVRPDIAERVLGHAIKGVEGTYDRHDYRDAKAHALSQLAALIEKIVAPRADNVVSIAR